MNVTLQNLSIEVTRRCNLRCNHCLRGDPQNLDLDTSLVSRLFDQINHIGCLTFTGGEPSLVPHIISDIIDIASEKNVEIGQFYIATNGKVVTSEFMEAVLKAYLYCDSVEDEETMCIAISSDIQHNEAAEYDIPEDNIKKLLAFKFAGKRDEGRDYNTSHIIWEGRAKDYFAYSGREAKVSQIRYDNYGDDIMIEEILMLNGLGNILPDCDLSYTSQDIEEIIICNVKRKNFSLMNSIKRYNKRCENGDIQDIKVA